MAWTTADAEKTRRIGLIDSHNDFPTAVAHRRTQGVYDSLGTYWLPRFRAGGIRVVAAPVWISSQFIPEGALRRAVQVVDGLLREIDDCADEIVLVRSFAEIEQAHAADKVAILLAFEGAEPLGYDLSALRFFYSAGLRLMSLTWSRRNAFGDGAWEQEARGGLTRLGRAAVAEMDRLGIVVDVSHASDQTARDILDAASGPVIASHSNARALRDHPRNMPDELLRAVAATDGVIGVTAVPTFISAEPATISAWVRHLEYVVDVAGIEHVGIGADFIQHVDEIGATLENTSYGPHFGVDLPPFEGMLGPDDLPALTAELDRRGFGEADLRRIYHENYLRVFARVLGG
jgi:membrane dipeptidase